MGYACPVCETPERDGEHLANHLAFTAMLHGGAHERWLDDHAPDWSDAGAAELTPVVVEHAEEAPSETVFEESVPSEGGHDHASAPADGDALDAAALDGDAGRILAEAREMTRAMLDDTDDDNKA
ncbi:DUF5810 domain-containing protein [Haloplanus sp. C73]|uniref:DUF5810 domain-containing protein n=1 Tax=Haloplanus sp. C73 TaxID=3421641 RepID=UPI003EB6E003